MSLVVRSRPLRTILAIAAVMLPRSLRRLIHVRLLGYHLHPTAQIGRSFVDVDHLTMSAEASIGHLTVVRGCEWVELGEEAIIGHLVLVTAVRRDKGFFEGVERCPALLMSSGAAVTTMHLLDCCDLIELERGSLVAGYWSMLMTHSFDHRQSRQSTAPIRIGQRTTLGTRATLLPGALIGNKCIVAAGATVVGPLEGDSVLWGGTPARALRELDPNAEFFVRNNHVLR